jgi:hypothetical protein
MPETAVMDEDIVNELEGSDREMAGSCLAFMNLDIDRVARELGWTRPDARARVPPKNAPVN